MNANRQNPSPLTIDKLSIGDRIQLICDDTLLVQGYVVDRRIIDGTGRIIILDGLDLVAVSADDLSPASDDSADQSGQSTKPLTQIYLYGQGPCKHLNRARHQMPVIASIPKTATFNDMLSALDHKLGPREREVVTIFVTTQDE
jgi:hypothetical protein